MIRSSHRASHGASFRRALTRVIQKNPCLLTVASLIFSLVMAEALVRVIAPQQLISLRPDIWRPDAKLAHRHFANVTTTVNTGEREVHFLTDEDGYRINANSRSVGGHYPKAILMIGDSFLEALQVENESTVPQLIARSLEQKTGQPVRVDNAGVGAWNPNHYYLMAQEALQKRRYDLGIVFISIQNDIVGVETETLKPTDPAATHHFKIPESFGWRPLIDAFLYPINDRLETRSHLFVLFRTTARVQLARLGLTADTFPNIFDKNEKDAPMWGITSDICEKIKNGFAAYNTPVFFVFLPPVYQVETDMFQEYVRSFNIASGSIDLELPNRVLKREFEKRGLVFSDPLEFMREKALKGTKMYGRIDRHFSEQGHKAVAECIEPMVESYLLDRGRQHRAASVEAGHRF